MSETTQESSPHAGGDFLSRFFSTLGSPKELYADIGQGAPWWQPWIWVSILNMVIVYISLPVQSQLIRLGRRGTFGMDHIRRWVRSGESHSHRSSG